MYNNLGEQVFDIDASSYLSSISIYVLFRLTLMNWKNFYVTFPPPQQ